MPKCRLATCQKIVSNFCFPFSFLSKKRQSPNVLGSIFFSLHFLLFSKEGESTGSCSVLPHFPPDSRPVGKKNRVQNFFGLILFSEACQNVTPLRDRGDFRKRPIPREFFFARAATRAPLSSSCSRDMPLQGPVQSQYERCRPSRRGDDVRVSLSEKQPFRLRKTGMGVRRR